jgi:hypothetical protein
MKQPRLPLLIAASAVAVALACSDTAAPPPLIVKPPAQLRILALAAGHLPLYGDSVQFWAVKGQNREASIHFQDGSGGRGERYAQLKVEAMALLQRPDGSTINAGDSVLITLKPVNPDSIYFEFRPAGLKFDPAHPVRLNIEYLEAGNDLNDDGVVNQQDTVVQKELAIWRQAAPSDDFTQLQSVNFEDSREIEANLTGFSRYAIAY